MSRPSKSPIWRPYTQERTSLPAVEIVHAKGSFLFSKTGQRIFDGISSWWINTHGHCHPVIVDAIQKQATKLDQIVFANFTHEPAEELAECLVEITPAELTRVFLSDNGSTAVEIALKMALQACQQSGKEGKNKFLSFAGGYHGDTVGAMSVSGESPFNRPYRKTLFEVIQADHPSLASASSEEFVRDFSRLIEQHHQSLAAVIIEPLIQGAGGMIVWPEEAVKKVSELCRKFDVYLIFDEVMTGFGRTGKLFAMDKLGVVPDFLCLSKGLTGGVLPLAVTMTTEDVYGCFYHTEKERLFFHGHSFTGNAISCAAAVANLKIFKTERTIDRIEEFASVHREQIRKIEKTCTIANARVCGSIGAFEFKTTDHGYLGSFSARFFALALERGLFLRPLGETIYVMPPYCSKPGELESCWTTVGQILVEKF